MKREPQYRHRDLFDDKAPAILLPSNRKTLTDLVRVLLSEIVTVTAATGKACDDKDHA